MKTWQILNILEKGHKMNINKEFRIYQSQNKYRDTILNAMQIQTNKPLFK